MLKYVAIRICFYVAAYTDSIRSGSEKNFMAQCKGVR